MGTTIMQGSVLSAGVPAALGLGREAWASGGSLQYQTQAAGALLSTSEMPPSQTSLTQSHLCNTSLHKPVSHTWNTPKILSTSVAEVLLFYPTALPAPSPHHSFTPSLPWHKPSHQRSLDPKWWGASLPCLQRRTSLA